MIKTQLVPKSLYRAYELVLEYDFNCYKPNQDIDVDIFNDNYALYSGASRYVLVGKEGYAYKFTFDSQLTYEENEFKPHLDTETYSWDEFLCRYAITVDYNLKEYEIYQEAIEYGVEKFFVPVELIEFEEKAILKQKAYSQSDFFCNSYDNINRELTFEEKEEMEMCTPECLSYELRVNFFLNYAFDELMDLTAFLLNSDVNDLHSGNVVMDNGIPKFVDYAGYNGLY